MAGLREYMLRWIDAAQQYDSRCNDDEKLTKAQYRLGLMEILPTDIHKELWEALKDKTSVIVPPRWTGNDGDGLLELKTFYMTQYLKLIKERELIGREVEVSSERGPPNFDSQMHLNSLMEQLVEVERQLDDLESEASLSIWG